MSVTFWGKTRGITAVVRLSDRTLVFCRDWHVVLARVTPAPEVADSRPLR